MALESFVKLATLSVDLNQVQRNIERVYVPLQRNPILSGLLLPASYVIEPTGNDIPHLLGQPVTGWRVEDMNADARIWRVKQSGSLETRYLHLVSSASVTIKLFVY